MSTFSVQVVVANPAWPERRLNVALVVDTGATYTLLPDEIVRQLELPSPWRRTATLASGEDMTFAMGQVLIRLNREEMSTVFLARPPGCQGVIGAVTLEQFALAADPVRQQLVPVARIFL